MDRRVFLQSATTLVCAGNLSSSAGQADRTGPELPLPGGLDFHVQREYPGRRSPKTMLFWDYWKFHHLDNVEVALGRPKWVPEGTYVDPHRDTGGAGRVFYDRNLNRWRKIDAHNEFFVCESDDGIHWRPACYDDVKPNGEKLTRHHVFTLPGEGPCPGWLYLDPIARDGFPYKIPVIQSGQRVFERAMANPAHRWHRLAQQLKEPRLHFMDHILLVSRDGLAWETRTDYDWGLGRFSPEEPHFMFFNHLNGKHTLMARPGLGDRRVVITMTEDFRNWTEPRIVLQPDLLDRRIVEFYAMPVFPYGTQFVGFVWGSHFANSGRPDFMVLHKGPQQPQLVCSSDGETFVRPSREPFIDFNEPGEIGCHSIRPEGMVTLDDEIRIYSTGGISAHGTPVPKDLQARSKAMILHTLRRDGFTYLRTQGYWGEFTTRPFTVFDGEFTMNAVATTGEVRCEIRSDKNELVEGYSLDESVPLRFSDALRHPLAWKNRKNLGELTGKVFRLRVKFYNARVFSFRGDYHFTDAHDARLLQDGQPIADTSRFGT